jgi:hypothetical protein
MPEVRQDDACRKGEGLSVSTPCTCQHCGHTFAGEPTGGHRVVAGDSTSEEAVSAAVSQRGPALCLTDPPYGLGDSTTAKHDYDQYVDTSEGLQRLIDGFLPIARTIAALVILTPGNRNHRRYPAPTWTMAWFTPAGIGRGPWGFCCWQPILCYGKDPKLVTGKGSHPDAIVHTESSEKNGHPCPKPVKFWSWLMERTSEPGDLVFDPFLGSGTSLIAAETTGRVVCGIEVSPAYVDLSVARWEAFTGKRAFHEKTGEPFAR